jgi:rod shape determining protein RodA
MSKTARQGPLTSASVFQKPTALQRLWRLLEGFDGPLAFAVFLLVCLGLLIMYSSGYDHGTRFIDHGRNMLIAGVIMFGVAQIMTCAGFGLMAVVLDAFSL